MLSSLSKMSFYVKSLIEQNSTVLLMLLLFLFFIIVNNGLSLRCSSLSSTILTSDWPSCSINRSFRKPAKISRKFKSLLRHPLLFWFDFEKLNNFTRWSYMEVTFAKILLLKQTTLSIMLLNSAVNSIISSFSLA